MTIEASPRRWSRLEYERLVDLGLFRPDERLELVGGVLTVREPQGGPHALAMELVGDALRSAFGTGWRVRTQLPVALDDESEPEPDFSVVPGSPREAAEPIPAHREPRPAPQAPYGWRYADVQTLGRNDSVSPLSVPSARLAVADLLP
jgi:Uma2 family endonuclease